MLTESGRTRPPHRSGGWRNAAAVARMTPSGVDGRSGANPRGAQGLWPV